MKILIVANEYFNFYNFRLNLIKKIFNEIMPDKIVLLANYDGFQKKINIMNVFKLNLNFHSRSINPFFALITIFKLACHLYKHKFKIIISYTFKCNYFLCILNYFYKKKLVVNITGLGEMYISKNIFKKSIFLTYCKFLQNCNYIICQNSNDKKILIKKNDKLKKKIIVIFGSGIDRNYFNFSRIKNYKQHHFLIVARIIKEKGILEFVNAAKKFMEYYPNKAKFTIIGNHYNDKFKNNFLREINKTQITYKSNSENIKNEIISSTCCVLPSYREGLSRFLLESISIGRPIITSDVPGCNILVDEDINGYLLKNITSYNLFELFMKITSLPYTKINNFSLQSRKKSFKFDVNLINEEIIIYIKKLLSN